MSALPSDAVLRDVLPDFCRWPALLLMAFIMELVAVMLTLGAGIGGDVLERFLLVSLYLQWIGLFSAAVLCAARRWPRRVPMGVFMPVCWLLLTGVTLVISGAGYEILVRAEPGPEPQEPRVSFLFRHATIGAIVALLALRYFWIQYQSRLQLQAEAEARYQALQARIRPHFLFNSLNNIAALVAIRPDDAERLIEDLSELMRASLDVRSRLVPLKAELELARAYLRIEQVRLDDRLLLDWQVPEELLDFELPLLSVQPLVENAVYHGVEQLPGPGTVSIVARREDAGIVVEVSNPRPPAGAPRRAGQRLAVDNIAQRLALIYGERARLELTEEGERFVARLHLPGVLNT